MATLVRPEHDITADNQGRGAVQAGASQGEALRFVAEGLARYKARDLVGAIDSYRQALASDPQCLEARERLGYALEEHQDILSEIGSARERLADRPDDVQARFRLAQRLETLRQWEEAMAEFASVGQIDASGRWGKSAQKMLRKCSLQMTA